MEKDKIIESLRSLQSDCANENEINLILEQLTDENNKFMIELLLNLKGSNLEQIEQLLDGKRQDRASLTDILTGLGIKERFLYQICKYISIWNIFNKILEIEDEKERINKELWHITEQTPFAKRMLIYLRDNPREDSLNVSKNISYNQSIVEKTLDYLCDKNVIYKISIGDKAVYDLTEHTRSWLNKNIDSYQASFTYNINIKHQYEIAKLKYKRISDLNKATMNYENYWINYFKFEKSDKIYCAWNGKEEVERIEWKEMAGMLEGIRKY